MYFPKFDEVYDFDSPSGVFPLYLSDSFLHGSLLLQVWYPSPGADPFKQEDFLQVCRRMFTTL